MQKLLILVAVVVAVYACTTAGSNVRKPDQTAELPQSTGPDPSDLLKVLQGKWRSVQDADYAIEFLDTRMRHYRKDQLSGESEIEIDGTCAISPCASDSADLQDGWCFIERDKSGAQCHIIFSCDKDSLKLGTMGAAEALLVFKKEE